MATTKAPAPQVGQVWIDNDPRAKERYVLIQDFYQGQAMCALCDATGYPFGKRAGKRNYTSIRLDRFRPTKSGYRFVSDRRILFVKMSAPPEFSTDLETWSLHPGVTIAQLPEASVANLLNQAEDYRKLFQDAGGWNHDNNKNGSVVYAVSLAQLQAYQERTHSKAKDLIAAAPDWAGGDLADCTKGAIENRTEANF